MTTPTIELIPRSHSHQPHTVTDWIGPHREASFFDAIYTAADELLVGTDSLRLLHRLADDSEAETLSARLLDAWERLDPAIAGGVVVERGDSGVRITVGVSGCSIVVEQAPTDGVLSWGWRLSGRRVPLAPMARAREEPIQVIRAYEPDGPRDGSRWCACVRYDHVGLWQGQGSTPGEAQVDAAAQVIAASEREPVGSQWGHEDAAGSYVRPTDLQVRDARLTLAMVSA